MTTVTRKGQNQDNPHPDMSRYLPHAILQASAASPLPAHRRVSDDWIGASNQPPSLEQLRALTAIPPGMVRANRTNQGGRRKGAARYPKDGKVVSKSFDLVARRPMPTLTSLEQGIVVTCAQSIPAYFASSVAGAAYTTVIFTVGGFAGSSAYLGLFDQYKFLGVEVWLAPASDALVSTGDWVTAVDLDDANTPSSFDAVLQKAGSLATSGQAGHYHRFLPHMATAVYSGAFTSFANDVPGWIDSASSAVQHYGIKVAAQQAVTAISYNLEIRAQVAFRGPGVP